MFLRRGKETATSAAAIPATNAAQSPHAAAHSGKAAKQAAPRAAGPAEPPQLTYAGAAQSAGEAAAMGRGAQADAADRPAGQTPGAPWQAGQPPLILARLAGAAAPQQPHSDAARRAREFTRDLPDWAKELLEKQPSAGAAGAAGRLPGQTRQIQWTAPQASARAAQNAAAGEGRAAPHTAQLTDAAHPPEMLHRQHGGGEDAARTAPQRKAEQEAELRRTADKVYRLIEERLRREMRRNGR